MSSNAFSIADLDQLMREAGGPVLAAYELWYAKLRAAHPVFRRAWGVPVTHPHRFMNFVCAAAFAAECHGPWLDVGCYDGALVMLLRRMGIAAYGIEAHDWPEMWRLIGVEDLVNVTVERPAVISVLNYAHSFEPKEFVGKLLETYGEPDLLLIDREERTPHPNNVLWYDEPTVEELGFADVISFPDLARENIDYGRELLVRRR